jgi:hypothetical protein
MYVYPHKHRIARTAPPLFPLCGMCVCVYVCVCVCMSRNTKWKRSAHVLLTRSHSHIGRERYFMTRTCNLEVKDRITGEPAEAELFAVGYHAHLLGIDCCRLAVCRIVRRARSCRVSRRYKFIELHFVCRRVFCCVVVLWCCCVVVFVCRY